MSERVRSFVAVGLDPLVRAAVASELDRLRPLARSVAWVSPANLHLTLKFLGEIPAETIEAVGEGLAEAAAPSEPFTLSIHGLGTFPGLARPRVVWIGALEGVRECQALQARIEDALARRGLPRETRPYTPHLTIGRVRQPRGLAGLREAIVQGGQKAFGSFLVSSISLMRSDLHPTGARYTELRAVSFSRH